MNGDVRHLNIGLGQIQLAAQDIDYLEAFAFVLAIKREYINSVVYDASIRKVMQICGCNYQKAVRIIEKAKEYGLIEVIDRIYRKKSCRYIIAKHLEQEKGKIVHFHVAESKCGKHLYIKPANKHIDDRYLNKDTKQTFKDIKDQILMAAVLNGLAQHNQKMLDFFQKEEANPTLLDTIQNKLKNLGMMTQLEGIIEYYKGKHEYGVGDSDMMNRGISIDKLRENTFGINNAIGKFAVRRLLNKLREGRYIKAIKNTIVQFRLPWDRPSCPSQYIKDFTGYNPLNDKYEYMGDHVYYKKGGSLTGEKKKYYYKGRKRTKFEVTFEHDDYILQLANTYVVRSKCIGFAKDNKQIELWRAERIRDAYEKAYKKYGKRIGTMRPRLVELYQEHIKTIKRL